MKLSSAALRLAAESGVPIYIHHPQNGKAEVRIHSVFFQNLPEIRRQQVLFALDSAATRWVIGLFEAKTQLQNDNLKFLQNRKPHLAPKIAQTLQNSEKGFRSFQKFEKDLLEVVRPHFLGIEGNLAKGYWAIIQHVFDDPMIFEDRNRRPATDRFNVALNYAYGMLYTIVEQACLAAGLDPQLGFFHADDYAKPTLAFDMIEPFRPWIDRMLLESFLKREPKDDFFEPLENQGITLSKKGKHWLIPALNEHLNQRSYFNKKLLTRKTHIFRFAGLFVNELKTYKIKKNVN
jgi:CRISP-associated protein Cas1